MHAYNNMCWFPSLIQVVKWSLTCIYGLHATILIKSNESVVRNGDHILIAHYGINTTLKINQLYAFWPNCSSNSGLYIGDVCLSINILVKFQVEAKSHILVKFQGEAKSQHWKKLCLKVTSNKVDWFLRLLGPWPWFVDF